MRTFLLASLAALSVSAFSADNIVLNSDFGVIAGTLANWDLVESIDGAPTLGTIGVTSDYSVSPRFSAQFNENFSAANGSSFLRQEFGAVTGVEEISLYGLSREQSIRVHLLYSDGTADYLAKLFTIPNPNDPVLNADWSKWDLTSDLNLGKTLVGIEVGIDTGGLNAGHAAWIDDVVVRATPVPEPASLAGLGIGAIAFLRRRSRRR